MGAAGPAIPVLSVSDLELHVPPYGVYALNTLTWSALTAQVVHGNAGRARGVHQRISARGCPARLRARLP